MMVCFFRYYSGVKQAPILTIFIGGNHEASNYLQELPYGGWVAPNIYYLGRAGVVKFGGLRIGGNNKYHSISNYLKMLIGSILFLAAIVRLIFSIAIFVK